MASPSTASELQLYRVLQRANLLQYYDTFISQGGDDVQQLCEAGEEEFLEIMALVGMASKPLHVRRLQKALQEWVTNPAVFQQPIATGKTQLPKPTTVSSLPGGQRPPPQVVTYRCPSPVTSNVWTPPTASSIENVARDAMSILRSTSPGSDSLDSAYNSSNTIVIDASQPMDTPKMSGKRSPNPPQMTSFSMHPSLTETQVKSIKDAAESLIKTLPPYAPKPMNMRKEICRDIERVMNMDVDDPIRNDEIRKYSAIYGRFDSKRKNDKPMSLHEISVNEAATQICIHMPSLLTRRDELFPLARDVVRDSGYQYSKGHSRAASADPPMLTPANKRQKLDTSLDSAEKASKAETDKLQRETRLVAIKQELMMVAEQQEALKQQVQDAKEEENYTLIHQLQSQLEELTSKHLTLLTEESDLTRKQKRSQRYLQSKTKPLIPPSTNDSFNTEKSSPTNGDTPSELFGVPVKNNNEDTKQFVNKSLFNEGLRIAQQYGMDDFATELIGMQPEDEEEVDEQSEWNREVEKDAEKTKIKTEATNIEEKDTKDHDGDVESGIGSPSSMKLENGDAVEATS
ncbi:unnamed protein product [Owenia fusiformis]|uniref:Uncharacterized protein n=1 Tax=Owenia fusiformis TaxID=6347 RepID=A0A8J1XNP7_OWEFU|nr:unnamed protein product [Owenia fusiformis]